jgi:hypothetical protein
MTTTEELPALELSPECAHDPTCDLCADLAEIVRKRFPMQDADRLAEIYGEFQEVVYPVLTRLNTSPTAQTWKMTEVAHRLKRYRSDCIELRTNTPPYAAPNPKDATSGYEVVVIPLWAVNQMLELCHPPPPPVQTPQQQPLLTVVELCAKKFRQYEASHLAKGTEDGRDKAATNALMASMCEQALDKYRPTPVTPATSGLKPREQGEG